MKCLQVAADLGMENNNLACDQKQLNINGAEKIGYSCHIFGDEPNCKINYTKPFVFKTGRRDCIPGRAGEIPKYFEYRPSNPLNG